jgi:hypothetical protein
MLSIGLVQMFSVLGVENSHRVLSAIAWKTDVELPLNLIDSDWWGLLNYNQSYTYPVKDMNKNRQG